MRKLIVSIVVTLLCGVSTANAATIESEPTIRVLIEKTSDARTFVSDYPYTVFAGLNDVGVVPPGEATRVSYADGIFAVESDSITATSSEYIRLVSGDPENHFVVTDLRRSLKPYKQLFNAYRGNVAFHYSPKNKAVLMINELPLELYLAGLAETSDAAHNEYGKALAVAARSYAITNIAPVTSKHLFDVYASTIDQLYLGYIYEQLMPRIATFAKDTRGLVVTYQGVPITAYYFAQSNGKTKSWKALGKTPKPWLQSVEAIYDKGKKLRGHGVGMSCRDASQRAIKDGWTYDQILTYYYSNTEVTSLYP